MKNIFAFLSLAAFCLLPYVAFGATNPIGVIGFEKEEYKSNEKANLLIEVIGTGLPNFPVDIYVDDMKSDGYKITTVDLVNSVNSYTSIQTIDLANHGMFKDSGYFNIFICKSGNKCSLQDSRYRKNILAATNLKISEPADAPSVDLKINGMDKISSVKWDEKLKITWKSKNSTDCSASGNYLPDANGGFWAGESPLDKTTADGVVGFYSNLKPFGEATVYAHPNVAGASEITIGVSCLSKSLHQSTDEITIQLKGTSKKEFKKPTPTPVVDITSPKEGKIWNFGKKQNIKWKSKHLTDSVEIELYSLDEGVSCAVGKVSKTKKSFSFTPKQNHLCDSGYALKPGDYMLEISSGLAKSQLNPVVIK